MDKSKFVLNVNYFIFVIYFSITLFGIFVYFIMLMLYFNQQYLGKIATAIPVHLFQGIVLAPIVST